MTHLPVTQLPSISPPKVTAEYPEQIMNYWLNLS
jgi:hypothetical protein